MSCVLWDTLSFQITFCIAVNLHLTDLIHSPAITSQNQIPTYNLPIKLGWPFDEELFKNSSAILAILATNFWSVVKKPKGT